MEFERQIVLMSWPSLDSTPVGTNTSNAKISPLDSTPVRAKTPDPKTLTLPTEQLKRKEKAGKYVTEDPESDPSSSDSSLSESDSSDDSRYRKSKIKRRDKKKKHRKRTKQDLSESLLSDSDFSDISDYKRKIRNKEKSYHKNKRDPIKFCEKLMEKLPTTAYKYNIIKFKFGGNLLQCRIYFLNLI